MKYLYEDFNEYAEIMNINKGHPNYIAFKMIWDMARTPYLTLNEDNELINEDNELIIDNSDGDE